MPNLLYSFLNGWSRNAFLRRRRQWRRRPPQVSAFFLVRFFNVARFRSRFPCSPRPAFGSLGVPVSDKAGVIVVRGATLIAFGFSGGIVQRTSRSSHSQHIKRSLITRSPQRFLLKRQKKNETPHKDENEDGGRGLIVSLLIPTFLIGENEKRSFR